MIFLALHPRTIACAALRILCCLLSSFTALDQIIADRPKKTGAGRNSQRGRRGGRSGRPSAKAAAVGAGAQNAAVLAASNRNKPPVVIPGRSANTGSKIILSNLPLDVTEAQVKVRIPFIAELTYEWTSRVSRSFLTPSRPPASLPITSSILDRNFSPPPSVLSARWP